MEFWRGLFKKKCTISETEVARPNFQDPHPLQLDQVVKCVLQFVTQNEIKSSRLVCHKWNLVAEPILRNRSTIVPPEKFNEYNSNPHFVNLPFSSFQLSYQIRNWNDSAWQEFCGLWMPNIRSLELYNIFGGVNTKHGRMMTEELLCGTPLLCLANNLVELRVSDCSTPLLLPFDCTVNIKILSLVKCSVIVHPNENTENRITPWNVSLHHVLFTLRNGNKLPGITINDYVDFTSCLEIELVCSRSDVTKITYDTLRDVTSARIIYFEGIRLLGKKIFHKKIDYIKMCSSFFVVQEPDMEVGDTITKCDCLLSTKSIEELTLPIPYNSPMYSIPFKCIDLPNLKYLNVDATRGYVSSNSENFSNAALTDMEIMGDLKLNRGALSLYLFNIPRSVKRLKLSPAVIFKVISSKYSIRALDFLILDQCSMIPFADADRVMKNIKPKVLVIVLNTWVSSSNIISFIHRNIHLERVIVKMPSLPLKDSRFFMSWGYEYYEFNNQIGEVLTEMEFNNYFLIKSD